MRWFVLVGLAAAVLVAVLWALRGGSGPPEVAPANTRWELAREEPRLDAGVARTPHTAVEAEEADDAGVLANGAPAARLADLFGRVVDPTGHPVPGATVTAGWRDAVTTDANGTFVVRDFDPAFEVNAEKEGYLRDAFDAPPRARAGGGWEELVLVLVPTATLLVTVRDDRGAPMPGLRVSVGVAEFERFGDTEVVRGKTWSRVGRASADTDASGRAYVERVATGLRLAVFVEQLGEYTTVERSGRLCEDPAEGAPLVLAAGATLRVEVACRAVARLRGVVLSADGTPAPGARVSTQAGGRPGVKATCGNDGRFALAYPLPAGADHVTVTAQREDAACVREVPLPFPDELVLTLQRGTSFAGRVVDASGAGVRAAVTLLRPGATDGPVVTLDGKPAVASSDEDGRFAFSARVFPGTYDVVADAWRRGTVRASGVSAGAEDLLLVLTSEPLARVTCEIATAVARKSAGLTVLRLQPHGDAWIDAPALPAERSVTEPGGWPEWAFWPPTAGDAFTSPQGIVHRATQGPAHPELLLPAGLYWIGARGFAEDGNALYPVATGLVRLAPGGEHRLHFLLEATARIVGRVPDAPPDANLWLDVVTARGTHVPLFRGRDLVDARPLAADGSFRLEGLPARELSLRVGTRGELAADRPRAERRVQLEPGEERRLEW